MTQGCGYRKLAEKYGISRTTICKWVQIYQGIHRLARSPEKQQNHYLRDMDDPHKKRLQKQPNSPKIWRRKLLHWKSNLQWEKLRADALDTMINVAEEKLQYCHQKKAWKPTVQESKKGK